MSTSAAVFITGKRGVGKTTLARSLIVRARRLLVFDPMIEYADCGYQTPDGRVFLHLLERCYRRAYRLVYAPAQLTPMKAGRGVVEFDRFCRLAGACTDTTVVVDEAHAVMTWQTAYGPFSKLLRFSRHRRNVVLVITHRPADVPRIVTGLMTRLCLFRLHEPNDLIYLRKIVGVDAAARIKALPDYRYLQYDADSGQLRERGVTP